MTPAQPDREWLAAIESYLYGDGSLVDRLRRSGDLPDRQPPQCIADGCPYEAWPPQYVWCPTHKTEQEADRA